MADTVLSSARDRGDPPADAPVAAQPFTHLGVPHAEQYRRLLGIFARAKQRFIVHLRPEDIAAELRIDADDQLTEALDKLVTIASSRIRLPATSSAPSRSPRPSGWRAGSSL